MLDQVGEFLVAEIIVPLALAMRSMPEFKVLKAVVVLDAVPVVRGFTGQEKPPKRFFHDDPMFLHVAVLCTWMRGPVDHNVTTRVFATATGPRWGSVALWHRATDPKRAWFAKATKRSRPQAVTYDSHRDRRSYSALQAGAVNHHQAFTPPGHKLKSLRPEIISRADRLRYLAARQSIIGTGAHSRTSIPGKRY
jgi:hypothetical protein